MTKTFNNTLKLLTLLITMKNNWQRNIDVKLKKTKQEIWKQLQQTFPQIKRTTLLKQDSNEIDNLLKYA